MKIDLLTLEYPPQVGGIATYLFNLYQNLPQQTVRIFEPSTTQIETWWWRPRWYFFYRRLKKEYKKNRPDEIHVSHVLPLGLIAWRLGKKFKIPFTVFFHGTDLLTAAAQPKKWPQVEKIVTAADRIVVNSLATAALYKKMLPNGQESVIITPGVTALNISQAAAYEHLVATQPIKNKRIILFLARLVERKGLQIALEAFANLHFFPDTILVVAGSGPEKNSALKWVKENNLTDRVLFLGNISDAEKWFWFSAAYLFWFPAQENPGDWEGFGIASLEAQGCGCPVIVSNVGGLPETVKDGDSGFVVEPTAGAFTAVTETILQDSGRWQKLRTGARRNAAEHTWEAARQLFSQVLNKV